MVKVEKIEVGNDDYPTNCYIIHDKSRNAVIIDPGYDKDKIIEKINKLKVKYIILTHCHADHLGALEEVVKHTKAKVVIHENDLDGLSDEEKSHFSLLNVKKPKINDIITVKDNDIIKVGKIKLEVIHTPGHTSGSMCLYLKNTDMLFTGDTLFANCYGRVDLKSGSFEEMKKSLDKIFDMFSDIIIYPGHEKTINIDDAKIRIKLLMKFR